VLRHDPSLSQQVRVECHDGSLIINTCITQFGSVWNGQQYADNIAPMLGPEWLACGMHRDILIEFNTRWKESNSQYNGFVSRFADDIRTQLTSKTGMTIEATVDWASILNDTNRMQQAFKGLTSYSPHVGQEIGIGARLVFEKTPQVFEVMKNVFRRVHLIHDPTMPKPNNSINNIDLSINGDIMVLRYNMDHFDGSPLKHLKFEEVFRNHISTL